ncbi:MAG: twin-arginine translocase TatA/TatE family subunit [Alphaproteobacteria bacterium]
MSIGVWQVVLILVIVLIIFGAGKLPKVMGDLAKGVKTFRSGLKDEEENKPGDSAALEKNDKDSTPKS